MDDADRLIESAKRTLGFREAAEPLMKWLSEKVHPQHRAIVTAGDAELLEGVVKHVTSKFLGDHLPQVSADGKEVRFLPFPTAQKVRFPFGPTQESPAQNNGWMGISTAPRDGTAILVLDDDWPGTLTGRAEKCRGCNTYVAEWWGEGSTGRWVCYMNSVQEPTCPINPTHWMPLPLAPNEKPPRRSSRE